MRCCLGVWFSLTAREVLGSILVYPDLTVLEVELLDFYRECQTLHLLTRSEARTIHTARNHSPGQGQIHGNKSELKYMALKVRQPK